MPQDELPAIGTPLLDPRPLQDLCTERIYAVLIGSGSEKSVPLPGDVTAEGISSTRPKVGGAVAKAMAGSTREQTAEEIHGVGWAAIELPSKEFFRALAIGRRVLFSINRFTSALGKHSVSQHALDLNPFGSAFQF